MCDLSIKLSMSYRNRLTRNRENQVSDYIILWISRHQIVDGILHPLRNVAYVSNTHIMHYTLRCRS